MLKDTQGRKIDYLRISVTDRCNLRCTYCMPQEGVVHKSPAEILSFEGIHKIVRCAADLGIKKVRITGGEPLVRRDLPRLISKLRSIPHLEEITLTTNGTQLGHFAHSLKNAGLDRVNISLDTLVPRRFSQITRGGHLTDVLVGIETAITAGLSPVKINMVMIRDFNTDEIAEFALLTRQQPLEVRFIEYMPTRLPRISTGDIFFSGREAKEMCSQLGELEPDCSQLTGTAEVFRIAGFKGTIGFISPLSQPFCASCNKLRLTSDGWLFSCLHSSATVHLKKALDQGADVGVLAGLFQEAVFLKPARHDLRNLPLGKDASGFSMCQIGG